jgi:hypothetical protein
MTIFLAKGYNSHSLLFTIGGFRGIFDGHKVTVLK